MLTTSLSKPQSMNLNMPEEDPKNPPPPTLVDERRTMTILLGEDNKIKTYMGLLDSPIEKPEFTSYGKSGIRQKLLEKVKSVPEVTGKKEHGLIVIIKPTKKSNYRNIVDILDEMAIAKVPTYAIVDISDEEKALLEK